MTMPSSHPSPRRDRLLANAILLALFLLTAGGTTFIVLYAWHLYRLLTM